VVVSDVTSIVVFVDIILGDLCIVCVDMVIVGIIVCGCCHNIHCRSHLTFFLSFLFPLSLIVCKEVRENTK
jgi:hypothetical protein